LSNSQGVIGAPTENAASDEFLVVLDTVFKIEKVKVVYAVKQAMLGGDIFDAPQNVTLVAEDFKQVKARRGTDFTNSTYQRR